MRKFDLGDTVWRMKDNVPEQFKILVIKEILIREHHHKRSAVRIEYSTADNYYPTVESKVFATKQELLDSL